MADEVYIDQEGNFRGSIIEYSVTQRDSQDSNSVNVYLKVRIDGVWDGTEEDEDDKDWRDNGWADEGVIATGNVNIVKKNGKELNKIGVEQLSTAGWDGSFESIADGSWEPDPISFYVSEEEYQGKTTYRVTNIRGYDDVPGVRSMEVDSAKSLTKLFRKEIKAQLGSKKIQSKEKPKGSPPQKTPPKKEQTQESE